GADERLAGIQLYGACGLMDGLHGGAAEAVDGGARDGLREACKEDHETSQVEALLGFGKSAAEYQILDVLRLDAGLAQQAFDDLRDQVVRADAAELPF